MPCRDDRPCSKCGKMACSCMMDRLNLVTDLLCKQCQSIDGHPHLIHPEVALWWIEHQEIDAKRLAKEKADKVASIRHKMIQIKELTEEIESMK